MGGLIGRAHLAAVPDVPSEPVGGGLDGGTGAELTNREALLLGALLSHEVAAYCDRFGGIDLVDPCALKDYRTRIRARWLIRLSDGGGNEGARLISLGRGEAIS